MSNEKEKKSTRDVVETAIELSKRNKGIRWESLIGESRTDRWSEGFSSSLPLPPPLPCYPPSHMPIVHRSR